MIFPKYSLACTASLVDTFLKNRGITFRKQPARTSGLRKDHGCPRSAHFTTPSVDAIFVFRLECLGWTIYPGSGTCMHTPPKKQHPNCKSEVLTGVRTIPALFCTP